jgi:hypothetical protein
MTTVHQFRRPLNAGTLPLFDWADRRERSQRPSYPAAWLRHRWPGLTPAVAEIIADLHFGGSQ